MGIELLKTIAHNSYIGQTPPRWHRMSAFRTPADEQANNSLSSHNGSMQGTFKFASTSTCLEIAHAIALIVT